MQYPALYILPKKGETAVGVVFPDIPDCYTSGENIDHAYRMAAEILQIRIDEMKAAGETVPAPRTPEQIKTGWKGWKEWTDGEEYAFVYVPYVPESKPRKYSLYLDSTLMARVDAVTDNRSAFFAKAAERMLGAS